MSKIISTYTIEILQEDESFFCLKIQRPHDKDLHIGGFKCKESAQEYLHEILSRNIKDQTWAIESRLSDLEYKIDGINPCKCSNPLYFDGRKVL